MKTFQIKSTNGKVLFGHECNSPEEAIAEAIRQKADLRGANLQGVNFWEADLRGANFLGADLRGANFLGASLQGVNFWGADLQGTNLQGTNLQGTNLQGVNLQGVNLQGANLRWANLRWANLRGASLWGANLQGVSFWGADLRGANLRGANFQRVNLQGADLRGADLRGANLWGANLDKKQLDKLYQKNCIVPDGKIIGWKKGESGYIIKLEIPGEARRMNAIGSRKCRAGYAKVLEIRNSKGHMQKRCMNNIHNTKIVYITGQTIYPDSYDPDPRKECSHGINFFITRQEAKDFKP